MAEVLAAVSRVTGVSPAAIRGARQHNETGKARAMFYLLAHDLRQDLSTGMIAKWIGRERTTVRDGRSQAACMLSKDPDWCSQYEQARAMLV